MGLLFLTRVNAEVAELALSLEDCRELVIRQNLEISAQKLQLEAAQSLSKGETSAFWEPVLVASGQREGNERENNTEQFISQGVDDFEERNAVYELALEQPIGTGGNVQLSYVLRDLKNNLREQRELEGSEREYEGFFGVVLTQPLLRNAGMEMSRASIRMAREESESAFQEWRRQMMQAIGSAEAAYWDLEITQRRVELREASVEVAVKVLEDNRARLDAGRGAEVEVQQAEAGLAVRQTQLLEARQGLVEASNRLRTFFSESIRERNLLLKAIDTPELREVVADPLPLYDEALMLHPDILIRHHRLAQQRIRRDFAGNQRLPELNLTGSYGYNSLGDTSSDAFSETWDSEYVSWSVGLQVRIPLGGNPRGKGEYRAAGLRLQQEETSLKATEIALMNQLATSIRRVENNLAQARNYQRVAELNAQLLETELQRLDAGQSDSRKVLDTEEKLSEALEAEASSMTRFMVAILELDLSTGRLLKARGLDPMSDDLSESTEAE